MWDLKENELLQKEFVRFQFNFPLIDFNTARKQIYTLNRKARKYFYDQGITINRIVFSSSITKNITHSDQVEYLPKEIFKNITLDSSNPDHMKKLEALSKSKLLYIVEMSKTRLLQKKTIKGSHEFYTFYLLPFESVEPPHIQNGIENHLGLKIKFTEIRVEIFIPPSDFSKIIDLFSENTILYALEWPFLLGTNWKVENEFNQIFIASKQQSITFIQTTRRETIETFIKQWVKIGIEKMFLITSNANLLFYEVILSTGISIIFKIPVTSQAIYSLSNSRIAKWFEQCKKNGINEAKALDKQRFGTNGGTLSLEGILNLDQLGIFHHDYPWDK